MSAFRGIAKLEFKYIIIFVNSFFKLIIASDRGYSGCSGGITHILPLFFLPGFARRSTRPVKSSIAMIKSLLPAGRPVFVAFLIVLNSFSFSLLR